MTTTIIELPTGPALEALLAKTDEQMMAVRNTVAALRDAVENSPTGVSPADYGRLRIAMLDLASDALELGKDAAAILDGLDEAHATHRSNALA